MKNLLMLMLVLTSISCQESKTEKLRKINNLIAIEVEYQNKLFNSLSSDSAHNAYLFAEKKESDRREDSLNQEYKKIEAEN